MRVLDGYTPQTRGQRFNGLIAEMLQCWSMNAEAHIVGAGEVDVAVEALGRQLILEAKWETTRTDTGALAKLQKRIRQRLGGTIGVFISMAGYTPDALHDLKQGEQLMVLCLTKDHFEAMLAGFVPPEELLGRIIRAASRKGIAYVETLNELFPHSGNAEADPVFGCPPEIPAVVVDATPEFTAEVVISALPLAQLGVAELAPGQLLLTTKDAILKANLPDKTFDVWLDVPDCSRSPLVTADGSVYVIRKAGVARVRNGILEVVAGGLVGSASLSVADNGDVWVFSNGQSET